MRALLRCESSSHLTSRARATVVSDGFILQDIEPHFGVAQEAQEDYSSGADRSTNFTTNTSLSAAPERSSDPLQSYAIDAAPDPAPAGVHEGGVVYGLLTGTASTSKFPALSTKGSIGRSSSGVLIVCCDSGSMKDMCVSVVIQGRMKDMCVFVVIQGRMKDMCVFVVIQCRMKDMCVCLL